MSPVAADSLLAIHVKAILHFAAVRLSPAFRTVDGVRPACSTAWLRHELAHAVIDAVSHNRAPRWLEEGFAIYLAAEGSMFARYATKTKLSPDEIDKRLERPRSQQEMRILYSLAYNQVFYLIQSGGEASVWKKLAA